MGWEAAMSKPILTLEEIDTAVAAARAKALRKANGNGAAALHGPHSPFIGNQDPEPPAIVNLQRASELKATSISWVWPGWLARGKAHIIGGQPGAGKTTLAMKIAATISTGGRWPGGTTATKGNVVIWSGEDDQADTLKPRLAASGADLDRVFFVQDVLEGKERRPFDPAKDIGPLKRAIEAAGGAVLLVIDPIVSAVAGDSHKNGETRRSLQPLIDLASDVGAALLGITHFSKGTSGREPIERITGSIAFGALARVVMVAAKEPEAEDGTSGRRILARAKSNIGPDEGGFAYFLELVPMPGNANIEVSVAVWGERIDGTARDMLAVAESSDDDGEGTQLREAKDFLLDFLMDGPKPAKVVQAAARDAGHRAATLRRAKDALGIASAKNSGDGSWKWALPQGAQQNSRCSSVQGMSTLSTLSTFKEKQCVRDEHLDQDAQGAHHFKVEHLDPDSKGGTTIDGWEGEI
jgi:putative DNA primase/helicase